MSEPMEMRAVYGNTLVELGRKDPRIMVLDADLMRSNGTLVFKKEFPERTINAGIAEANMVGVAAGLSNMSKIPFAATFGVFASRRAFDQFFISANYAKLNVKLAGTDPGISAGFNGGTHMPFEDLGMMRTIPGLTIVEPSDPVSFKALIRKAAETYGCWYLRFPRMQKAASLYPENEEFETGKGKVLRDGNDVTIVALGTILVPEALKAAGMLSKEGIDAAVIDTLTVKPLDEDLIVSYAEKTNAVITAENAQISGGLAAAVALCLAQKRPTKMAAVGVHEEFGQVATTAWLQRYYKLTAEEIVLQAKWLLEKK